jgi:hypothetical protein
VLSSIITLGTEIKVGTYTALETDSLNALHTTAITAAYVARLVRRIEVCCNSDWDCRWRVESVERVIRVFPRIITFRAEIKVGTNKALETNSVNTSHTTAITVAIVGRLVGRIYCGNKAGNRSRPVVSTERVHCVIPHVVALLAITIVFTMTANKERISDPMSTTSIADVIVQAPHTFYRLASGPQCAGTHKTSMSTAVMAVLPHGTALCPVFAGLASVGAGANVVSAGAVATVFGCGPSQGPPRSVHADLGYFYRQRCHIHVAGCGPIRAGGEEEPILLATRPFSCEKI